MHRKHLILTFGTAPISAAIFAQMIGMVFLLIELELQKLRAGMETMLAANEEKVTVNGARFSAGPALRVFG